MERRRFNSGEHVALFVASAGACAECGADLTAGWHADHIVPYVAGGRTDVKNGQALCPECNLKKGARMELLRPWPDNKPLRLWQERAFRRFLHRRDSGDFLLEATPGAGKTTVALRIAHQLLTEGSIERLVVVCPTSNLRIQWGDAAAAVGIFLDPTITNQNGRESPDYQGVAVTYQQVAAAPEVHRINCRRPTLTVFDEIHHAGDPQSWAASLRYAFEFATQRLGLSGTPFRTDNQPIPFVTYENGRSRADFSYTYADSLGDHDVCRPVLFPSFEGRMEWLSEGQHFEATFQDELPDRQAGERLNTALHPKGDWLPTVIRQANEKLMEIREQGGHPNAAGLIITKDQHHATEVAKLVTRVTGAAPTLAISDDPDASAKIHEFKLGRSLWIVAVRMVSEGVDIPRLRVCVYATNYLTEMYFRQAVGRVVRWVPGLDEQSAYFYIPKVAELVRWAQRVKEERDHQLQLELEKRQREGPGVAEAQERLVTFAPIASQGQADAVIFDGEVLEQDQLAEAQSLRDQAGLPGFLPAAMVAKLLRLHSERLSSVEKSARPRLESTPAPLRLDQKKRAVRGLIGRQVSQLALAVNLEHREIHRRLHELDGVWLPEATMEQLEKRVEVLGRWLREWQDGA